MACEDRKIDFQSSVIDKKLCSITMEIKVPENIAVDEISSVFSQIQQRAVIGGFRQGRVPMNIIKKKFAVEAKNKAIENIIKKTIMSALERENFVPFTSPVVEKFDCDFNEVFKYRFTAECHPKIDVEGYKNIPLKREIFKIGSENLEQGISTLRERNARLVSSKSGRALESSFVFVDYNAFGADGRALAGITAKNYLVDLNSQNVVSEFKEALKDARIGDERIAKIEYKADYPNKILAGKTVTFKIKVIEIKEKELPELNDDFAKDLGAENLEDLKIKVKESMKAEEKRRQDMDIERQIIEYLLEKNKFEVPQSLIAEQKKSLIGRMKNYLKNQGLSREYVEEQIESRHEKFKEEAKKNLRLSYILNAVYAKENLAVTEADIETEKNKIKTLNPGMENAADKYFSEKRESIIFSLKERKIFSFLIGSAKIETEEKNMPLREETKTQRDNDIGGKEMKTKSEY